MRLYYSTNAVLSEYKFYTSDWTWERGQSLATNLMLNPAPQFAGSPFNNWADSLVVARNPDGFLTGYSWNGSHWVLDNTITLAGGPSKPSFDYIALNMEGRFYGIIGGVIHEYRWYAADPYTFDYVGPVTILGTT